MAATATKTQVNLNDNSIIHGDNLTVLNLLSNDLEGKVQAAIVDPPYAYPRNALDAYDGDWEAFLRPRLEAVRATLKDSGACFIHVDDNHLAKVRMLGDEVFGAGNFLNMVIVKTADPSGLRSINSLPFNQTEYVLVYARSRKDFTYIPQYVEAPYDHSYRNIILNPEAPHDQWEVASLPRHLAHKMGYRSVRQARELLDVMFEKKLADYALEHADHVYQSTRVNPRAGSAVLELEKKSRKKGKTVVCLRREHYADVYMRDGRQLAFYATKLKEVDGRRVATKKLTNLWTDIPYHGVGYEGEARFGEGKKPERLVRRMLSMCTEPGDLVLDIFGGSGSTAAASEKLGRNWLTIESNRELIDNLIVPRLTRVVNGLDETGLSKVTDVRGGGSFSRYKMGGDKLVAAGRIIGVEKANDED